MAKPPPWLRPWVADERAAARRTGAVSLARWAADAPDLTMTQRRALISVACWWVTEDNGKWGVRHRTSGALAIPVGGHSQLRHEHVVTRKSLVDLVLARPEDAAQILDTAIACTVTKDEHSRLTRFDRTHVGWARYLAAGLTVIDMEQQLPVIENGAYVNGGPKGLIRHG